MSTAAPGASEGLVSRLRVGQWLLITIGALLAFAVGGIAIALAVNQKLGDRRHVVLDEVSPALRSALKLENALINEETGIRGYVITAQPQFLQPYESGLATESEAFGELSRLNRPYSPQIATAVAEVHARAVSWREQFVVPAVSHTRASRSGSVAAAVRGKALFDRVRAALARLQGDLEARLSSTRRQLNEEAEILEITLFVAGVLIIGSVLGAGLLLRRIITRPLTRLGREAEEIAQGQFSKPLAIDSAPREIVELAAQLDTMRQRIVRELSEVESARARLEDQARELERSNTELEQFAYVASHDLQEPLRKVASFCQALERRYRGQLDERADQYIDFAVDGAKRMQVLINDLLAFSRVGRSGREREIVALDGVVAEARASLSSALAEAAATVEVAALPEVNGDRTLLVSLFQNLIANAVKFHAKDPPVIAITAQREQGYWRIDCLDNGIGVESEYAERIFVIFQRLHTKEAYPGTGIGLAMCRKIVEYHGGRMWLDEEHTGGALFHFTLPILEETK